MKRKILALLLALMCLFAIASCNKDKSDNDDEQNPPASDQGGNQQKPDAPGSGDSVTEDFIYAPGSALTLVYDSGKVSVINQGLLYDALLSNSVEVSIANSAAPEQSHEIVVGKTDRAVSKAAYLQLGRMEKEEGFVGYYIYSDGNSIAIAYDEEYLGFEIAQDAAVSKFINEIIKPETLKIKKGVVASEIVDAIAYQAEIDNARLEKDWAALEGRLTDNYGAEAAAKMISALQSYYSIFSDDVITWFANLYDPGVGGFYYSNSGRNVWGYLPDLESTNQTLGFLTSSGITTIDEMDEFIPDRIQEEIVAFVKGLQDPTNGYFYHPQWGKELTDTKLSRRGRDLKNAITILSYFNEIPTYDAPNGTKGEYPLGTTPAAPASYLTERLSASHVSAVSKVIFAADADAGVDSYLLNEENFRNYLKSFDERIKTDAYWVGNNFESLAPEIVARDKVLAARGETYSLAEIATEWFTSHQDPETGLWEPYEDNEYDCINGILKIASAYHKLGQPVPRALDLLDYAIDAITSDADPHHVCCVLNTWYAISTLSDNIKAFSETAKEDIAAIKAECIEKYPEMVLATRNKVSLFVKTDGASAGGFSYFQTKTSTHSQEVPVALDNVNEADVNSTYICTTSIGWGMFGFIDERPINVYTASDGMKFKQVLLSLGEVIKDTEVKPVPIDFEDTTVDELFNEKVIDKWLPNGELVVENGTPYGEVSRVMRLTSAGANALFQLNITKAQGVYNAIGFETDMMFDPETTCIFELLLFGSQSSVKHLNVMLKAVPGDGVYVYSSDFEDTKIADCGQWFKFRVDYGKVNESTLKADIIINGTVKATCKTPYTGTALGADTLKRIQFSAYHAATSIGSVYFDNMFLEQCIRDIPVVPDEDYGPSEEETGILNFDRKSVGAYYNQNILDSSLGEGQLTIVDGTPFGEDSKVLSLTTYVDSSDLLQVKTTKTLDGYSALKFEAAMMFNNSIESTYELLIFGASAKRGYNLYFEIDSTGVYVSSYDLEKTKVAEVGAWFNFSVVYTKVDDNRICAEVCINNERLTIDTTPYDPDVIPAANEVYRIQLSASTTSVGAMYLDNVGLTQIAYEIPELPGPVGPTLPDPVPESPFEGGNVGNDDWT